MGLIALTGRPILLTFQKSGRSLILPAIVSGETKIPANRRRPLLNVGQEGENEMKEILMVFAAGVIAGVTVCVLARQREFFKSRISVWLACVIVLLVSACGLFLFGLRCGAGAQAMWDSGSSAVSTVSILRSFRSGETNAVLRKLENHLDGSLMTHGLCLNYTLLPETDRKDLLNDLHRWMTDVVLYRTEYPTKYPYDQPRTLIDKALAKYSAQPTSPGDNLKAPPEK
jgi:hypothetical protein